MPFAKTKTDQERFEEKIFFDTVSGCWLWTAKTSKSGYGDFWNGVEMVRAHRWAYEQFFGMIPEDLVLDHTCRTRCCVNPSHVRPVTQAENVHAKGSEALAAANSVKTQCPRGHALVGENLIKALVDRGERGCRACNNARALRRLHSWTEAETWTYADSKFASYMGVA
jgi:hypothetical protein